MRGVALCLGLWLVLLAPGARAAEDPLGPAASRVRAGDAAGALSALTALPEALSGAAGPRYLRARLLMEQGDRAGALAALPSGKGLPAAVADDVAVRRAELLGELGRCAEAEPQARALAGRGLRRATMWALVGRCARQRGDAAAAAQALEWAVEHARGPRRRAALRLSLAEARLAAGQRDAAIELLRELRLTQPDRPEAQQAQARLSELGAASELDRAQRLSLAERWLKLRQPARALEVLDGARAPAAGKARAAWLHLRGMALYKHRTRYREAAIELQRAARARGDMEAYDSFHAARAWARADRDRRAVRALRRFVKRYPRSRFVPRASYTAAWLELRHGMAGGRRNMLRFLDSDAAGDAPKLARTGLFQLAMHAFDRRRHGRAQSLFERYAQRGKGAMVRGRGLYWAGRAAQLAGKRARAIELYRQVRQVQALHWYALLSARRLDELGEPPAPPFPAADEAPVPAPLSPSLPAAAAFYTRLGLLEDARAALVSEREAVTQRAPAGRGHEALALAHAMLGDHARAYRLAVRQHDGRLDAAPGPLTRWAWDAAYARPHVAAVAEHARAQRLEAALIYAVMRKESAFDASVVSYADAIGLMQLLPKTAEKVATGLGQPYERELLFEPAYNLELGARLLGQLRDRFEGQLPLALAAYNAGAHRVEPWLKREAKRGGRVDLDLFVERIPIEQTRNYVRRVLTNWARYRYLEDGLEPWEGLPVSLSALSSSARRRR